jgi:hypothetical protein
MAGLLEYTKNGQVTEPPLYRFMRGNVQSFLNSIPDPSKMTPEEQLALGANVNPIMGLLGATAYHGSPAIFDKFDINKLGSGQGAQAYGHGIYFAENPAVAKEYQKQLSGWQPGVQSAIKNAGGNIDDAIQQATKSVDHYKGLIAQGNLGMGEERANSLLDISTKKLSDLQAMKAGVPENTGAFYKVDIPDQDMPKMLNWDMPMNKQSPEVLKALKIPTEPVQRYNQITNKLDELQFTKGGLDSPEWKKLIEEANTIRSKYGLERTGEELYTQAASLANSQKANNPSKAAANSLLQQGITGIRYLDQGSRQAGGTSNFVVFDPSNVKILERNNKGLLK